MTPQAVMMFAAGFGTRMGTLTADRPKPLIEVAGTTLIDHAIDLARDAGLGKIVVNTHYKAGQISAHLAETDVAISHEDPDILDTGGGLRHALPLVGTGPVFTMNTDAIWQGPNPFQHLANHWQPDRMDALLLCVPRDNAVGHNGSGDFIVDDTGRASRGSGMVYSGAQIIKTDRIGKIPETVFSLNVLWNDMLKAGRVYATAYAGQWCDVGHPKGIELAENMLGWRDV